MNCLILIEGYSSHLYPLPDNYPKPICEVKGKTIYDVLVDDIDTRGLVNQYVVVYNHKFIQHFVKWTDGKIQNIKVLDDDTSTNKTRLGSM